MGNHLRALIRIFGVSALLIALFPTSASASAPQLSIFAGTVGNRGEPSNGPATATDLNQPYGLDFDSSGIFLMEISVLNL